MSLLIDNIRIAGFRGISNLEISLPRVTVLIGTNNSGKTSVIKALQLALGDYARYLSGEDFYIDKHDKIVERILVDVRIVAIDEHGDRASEFSEVWQQEFGDRIQSEADGNQFLALRTECQNDTIKGGFAITRYALDRWPEFDAWQAEKPKRNNRLSRKFDALPFISIEAQRDIHKELREKTSFVGRVLSSVEYAEDEIAKLEEMVQAINEEAVSKSQSLQKLKNPS